MLGGEANSIVATVFGTLAAMVALKPAGLLGKAGIEKV